MKAGLIAVAATVVLAGSVAVAAALTSMDSQVNKPQVAGDASSDLTARFPTNKQNEPAIAVDPQDSSRLIAGSNDEQLQPPCGPGPVRGSGAAANDCSFFPNVGTDGVYTSSDGGSTWTNRGLLPGFSDSGGSLVSGGDPVIVYGPKLVDGSFTYAQGARAYYAGLANYATGAANGNQAPELMTVSTSNDDGVTWSNPVVAANAHGYVFNDKEAIWVDRNPSSPYFGRVYVSWTQFRDIKSCAEPVMFASSADGGTTWSAPNQITAAHNCGLGGRQGSTIRTTADGRVYLIWEDSDQTGSIIAFAVSRDGGRSFSRPATVAHLKDIADPIPGSNFRTDSFPSAGIDQGSSAIYIAYADASSGSGLIVVAKSTDGGASWTQSPVSTAAEGYAFFQGLDVASNGRIDVAYQAQNALNTSTYGMGNATVDSWYTSSSDGGANWSTPVKVSSVSSDPAVSAQNNLARQFWGDYNTLASSASHAWFIYTDSRTGAGCPAVDAYQHGTASKPAPGTDCPPQFGNTDVYVSKITP